MKRNAAIIILLLLVLAFECPGQNSEQTEKTPSATLLVYTRTISNAAGTVRVDLSVVPNFKLTQWLRMELGLRHGVRSGDLTAYDHYKVELQTKSFLYTRFVARMSDNVVRYGSPNFSRTNYLLIAENRFPLSQKFDLFANVGYVVSYSKNDLHEAIPELSGIEDDHLIYKFALRYKLSRGMIEGVWGTYDIFNPYLLDQPFLQVSFEYDLWKRGQLYSYFRYQYNQTVSEPLNDFLGLGVRFKLGKG